GGTYLGTFGNGTLNQPRQLVVHPTTHDVYVVNARDRQVVVYNQDGVEQFRFGSECTGPGQFEGDPRGITITTDGTAYVTDAGDSTAGVSSTRWLSSLIIRVSADGSRFCTWGHRWFKHNFASTKCDCDVDIQPGTRRVCVPDRADHEIEVFSADGAYVTRWGS